MSRFAIPKWEPSSDEGVFLRSSPNRTLPALIRRNPTQRSSEISHHHDHNISERRHTSLRGDRSNSVICAVGESPPPKGSIQRIFRSRTLIETPPERSMECLWTTKQRKKFSMSDLSNNVSTIEIKEGFDVKSPMRRAQPKILVNSVSTSKPRLDHIRTRKGVSPSSAATCVHERVAVSSSDSELSDDEGERILRSPNPFWVSGRKSRGERQGTRGERSSSSYSCNVVESPKPQEDQSDEEDGSFLPRLQRSQLHTYLGRELERRKHKTDSRSIKTSGLNSVRGLNGLCQSSAEATVVGINLQRQGHSDGVVKSLVKALNGRVPEYSHVKAESEGGAAGESPFTPRTRALIDLARLERLHDEWRRQRALAVKELADGSTLLSTQKPSYADYCRCVRAVQHYSCDLPRWAHVMSRSKGDPCFIPPLFLSDVPKGGGWRFYNFSISLSVASKIVARKEAMRSRGPVSKPPGLGVDNGDGGFLSKSTHLGYFVNGNGREGHMDDTGEPHIELVDIMHNLYPLSPIGPLKTAISGWTRQLKREIEEKCRTRVEQLSPDETRKVSSIFHILVEASNGMSDGTRIDRDTFITNMPRGDRNVTAQLQAFAAMFDQYSRVETKMENEDSRAGTAVSGMRRRRRRSNAGVISVVGRGARPSVAASTSVTPASMPLSTPVPLFLENVTEFAFMSSAKAAPAGILVDGTGLASVPQHAKGSAEVEPTEGEGEDSHKGRALVVPFVLDFDGTPQEHLANNGEATVTSSGLAAVVSLSQVEATPLSQPIKPANHTFMSATSTPTAFRSDLTMRTQHAGRRATITTVSDGTKGNTATPAVPTFNDPFMDIECLANALFGPAD